MARPIKTIICFDLSKQLFVLIGPAIKFTVRIVNADCNCSQIFVYLNPLFASESSKFVFSGYFVLKSSPLMNALLFEIVLHVKNIGLKIYRVLPKSCKYLNRQMIHLNIIDYLFSYYMYYICIQLVSSCYFNFWLYWLMEKGDYFE